MKTISRRNPMERIDLHVHTVASDGTLTAREVVRSARDIGLRALALTDHDSVGSVKEGMEAAREAGVAFVSGVELTCLRHGKEVHVLGYHVDPEASSLVAYMECVERIRQRNSRVAVDNLVKLGLDISWEEHQAYCLKPQRGGWPLINLLKEKGYVRNYPEYFDKYFGPGRPAYIPPNYPAISLAIRAIREAGGIAVLAHPASYMDEGEVVDEAWLRALIAEGLKGLEAFSPYNNGRDPDVFSRLAERLGLLSTGGSDFHGSFTEGRSLGGVEVGYKLFEALELNY
ncbi:MAG: PHP domain-containing protein [Candidatus Binatia bacterium]